MNVAGGAIASPMEIISDQDFYENMAVEVFAAHKLTQIFLPLLKLTHGRVLNVSSSGTWVNSPGKFKSKP